MFLDCAHLVVYPAEQFDDKVFCGHGSYLQQFGDYRLYDVRDLFSTSTNGYYRDARAGDVSFLCADIDAQIVTELLKIQIDPELIPLISMS
jgi:hypothetical protein